MGNSNSAATADPRFVSATRAFTQNEIEELRSLFESLASQSHNNGEFVSSSVFKRCFGIHGALGDRMFDLVTRGRHDQKLSFEDLVIAKATYEKGQNDEIEEFMLQLLDVNGDGSLGRLDVEAVLCSIIKDLFPGKDQESAQSTEFDINIMLNVATFSKSNVERDEKSMSLEDLKSWFNLLPSVRKYLGGLLTSPDQGRSGSQVPRLLYHETASRSVLLREEFAWLIGGALSLQEQEEWKLLYNSSLNGQSFNTFMGSISDEGGPTVIIVKDKDGYIFGGYASRPWERHSNFYGDMKSFLFQLYKKASIFRPTGANNSLQWFAVNYSSESIPNGIGFGGRVGHFGLFISASFDQGHSFSCSTFGSPCLSKANQIFPEVIECWGIVTKAMQQERTDAVRGTVLERFKEERNMLNMVGIANSSE
ncbi:MTOR-associated protein MEAK7-like protein [Drosera capensis]